MENDVSTDSSKDTPLPLASLRLLVPPLQLMAASLWQVLQKQDVANYWNVADFVSFVTNMVPELLMCKHRAQLELGLRARYIIELCRDEELLENEIILSHLDMMKSQHPYQAAQNLKAVEEEEVTVLFLELIQTLLKDPEERHNFFLDVFPVEFGRQYQSDLQTLFWAFLSRLLQFLPVPDLKQTMLWLGAESSVMEDCVLSVSKTTDLKLLLYHHKDLGHLEQHVPCAGLGESIISTLSSLPRSRMTKTTEQSSAPLGLDDEKHPVSFVDSVAVEIISVTDYSEVELGPSADFEVVIEEHSYDRADRVPEGGSTEFDLRNVIQPQSNINNSVASRHRASAGPHDCPDCEKKFKFASSLNAHRVIHTGERPHRCNDCGRCFSFRQSLERHRYTHKTGRKYDCAVCGETFFSLSARTEHKQMHMEKGVNTWQQENRKFTWEHGSKPTKMKKHGEEAVKIDDDVCEDPNQPDDKVETEDKGVQDPENAENEISEGATCWSEVGLLPESDNNQTASTSKVRTSGRKRKPTMKIQAINLQKCLNRKGKTITKVGAPDPRPLPLSCAEHSYGSSMDSPKHSEETQLCQSRSFQHPDEVQVQQHMNSLHSAEREDKPSLQPVADEQEVFSCSDCDKSFKFQSLLNAHRRIHTGEQPFLCSQCGRHFSFKQSLDRHKETHKSGRNYKCLICGEFFKSLVAQREHKNTHMENGAYLCSECGRAFTWKSALVRHMKTHCEDPEEGERPHTCPQCELSFSCASYLSRHLQTHQEARAHACNCGKSFAYRAALSAHQRIHLKERPHTCTQCGKGFLYRGGLRNHMKIHSEEMPFMCSFCGKSFKRERSLKKHERCHTRENVFKCSQCDKSFVYKATLTRHELTHSGERPFLCSDCGKGFFSHAELLKHERFHTGHKPFQCPHCGKKFTQSCYLTIHLRYHTGVRPYSCTECDKSFLSANRLKRHQRIHSGEKPFLCGECGKSFRQSYNLKMHQQTHSKK